VTRHGRPEVLRDDDEQAPPEPVETQLFSVSKVPPSGSANWEARQGLTKVR